MDNAVNWFDIPVVDLDRATKFYSEILSSELRIENFA
ncbi:MAG TPA: VOC family protein, partial [Trueperaceae bacterium]|nr:VOC family protein [Trueperaceae bacterium]